MSKHFKNECCDFPSDFLGCDSDYEQKCCKPKEHCKSKKHCKPKKHCKVKKCDSKCHDKKCDKCDPACSELIANITPVSQFPTLPGTNPGISPGDIAIGIGGFIFIRVQSQKQIWRANPDGTNATLFINVPSTGPIFGIAISPVDNLLYILGGTPGEVFRVSQSGGTPTLFASMIGSFGSNVINGVSVNFNGMVFDKSGNIYVTDSNGGRIFKVSTAGVITLWLDDPLLRQEANAVPIFDALTIASNGVVLNLKENKLYTIVTVTGRIVEVPILSNGLAGVPSTLVHSSKLISGDGLTIDANGYLWLTTQFQSPILRINPKIGEIVTVVDTRYPIVDGSTSVLFLPNKKGDCTLTGFFTSSATQRSAPASPQNPYTPGAPNPRLFRLDIQYGYCNPL
jgi:streptogramin lyase